MLTLGFDDELTEEEELVTFSASCSVLHISRYVH